MDENQAVRKWIPLVHKLSQKIKRCGALTYEDIFSAGLVGVLHAIRTFEANRGTTLKTWVYEIVQKHIYNVLRQEIRHLGLERGHEESTWSELQTSPLWERIAQLSNPSQTMAEILCGRVETVRGAKRRMHRKGYSREETAQAVQELKSIFSE